VVLELLAAITALRGTGIDDDALGTCILQEWPPAG
jgi:hypothetical protein